MSRQRVRSSLRQKKWDPRARKQPPRRQQPQPGGNSSPLCPAHYRERRAASSNSSHVMTASASDRIGSSSCGSRHALPRSSAHREQCMPLPGRGTTPAAGSAHRIDAKPSFPHTGYLDLSDRSQVGHSTIQGVGVDRLRRAVGTFWNVIVVRWACGFSRSYLVDSVHHNLTLKLSVGPVIGT